MKKKIWYFQTKLILLQIFLVLPILILASFVSVYWMRKSAIQAIDSSRNNSLQTEGKAFDQQFSRMIKLLEKPYTDEELYSILTKDYNELDRKSKYRDDLMAERLLRNISYYEPNISSITLVSEITDSVYYRRLPPSTMVNVHNPEWYDLTQSDWYRKAVDEEQPIIYTVYEEDLYLGSGPTIAFVQRLKNVMQQKTIGVIRIDLSLQSFYSDWGKIAQDSENDIFLVADRNNQLIYASSQEFLEYNNTISTVIDPELLAASFHINRYLAEESGMQFYYLSRQVIPWRGQPLSFMGLTLIAFYVIYAVVFIRWSTRYISRPISQLKHAMILGGENDLTSRCPPLMGEMGTLSDAFNSLMEQLGKLIEESVRNEQEKAKLAYETLQSKINPHFLYNTLNAIRWKADMIGALAISHALESLASLLKFTIKCTDEIIPFEEELRQLENYIQIMRIRYGDGIEFDFDIDDEVFKYQCLKFMIQPSVENSLIHAFNCTESADKLISVTVTCGNDNIMIVVEDNGEGMTPEQINQILCPNQMEHRTRFFGIGISSVRQRIETLFGEPYTLSVESVLGHYTRVTAVIPKIPVNSEE